MPNPRGRPTNEERARRAAEAARQAETAAQSVQSQNEVELPVETSAPPEPRQERQEEEKSELTLRAPRNDVRRQAMEEIEARDIQTKTGLGMELGLTDEEKPKTPEKAEIPKDLAPPTAESMLQGGKFSSPTVRVKVDGEEFDVPQNEIDEAGGVQAYRVQRAADNRLREAKATLAEAKRLQASHTETPKQSPDDFLKQKIEVLRWGTPDESAQAFKEILERQNKPVDQNQLVEMAADRIRHDEAVRAFDKEFQDIGASQLHLKLIVALRNERLQKGHPGDWNHFYRSLGNEVRAVMPKQSQPGVAQSTTGTPSQASDKEERKSSIVNLPQTAAQRASVQEEPKTETRADLINSMRKARGLPIA
jgi:hypothetical protein